VSSLLRALAMVGALAWLASPATADEIQPSEIQNASVDASVLDGSPAAIDVLPGAATALMLAAAGHDGLAVAPTGESGGEHAGAHAGHDAHGAEHSEHAGFSGKTFALQLLNFGVLLFLLIWFVWWVLTA